MRRVTRWRDGEMARWRDGERVTSRGSARRGQYLVLALGTGVPQQTHTHTRQQQAAPLERHARATHAPRTIKVWTSSSTCHCDGLGRESRRDEVDLRERLAGEGVSGSSSQIRCGVIEAERLGGWWVRDGSLVRCTHF